MLFKLFNDIAEKFPEKLALNNYSFKELLYVVKNYPYKLIVDNDDETVLISILKASQLNLPLVVVPLNGTFDLPKQYSNNFTLYLYSSGSTTGQKKSIPISEKHLIENCRIGRICNRISPDSKILTVCSMRHTGGINAQSLPALLTGAHVIIDVNRNFSQFFHTINLLNITHCHLTPRICDLIEKLKTIATPTLEVIMCGSDCVHEKNVKFWIERGVRFILNYGLTEAGPIIINHEFLSNDELHIFEHGVPLGTKIWCEYKIENNSLYLKGDNVSDDDWLDTKDCVVKFDQWYIYNGRKSAGCKIIPKGH